MTSSKPTSKKNPGDEKRNGDQVDVSSGPDDQDYQKVDHSEEEDEKNAKTKQNPSETKRLTNPRNFFRPLPKDPRTMEEPEVEFNAHACLRSLKEKVDSMRVWVWEICCGSSSTLTAECLQQGYSAERFSLHNLYHIDKKEIVENMISQVPTKRPTQLWGTLRCTPWTNIQNLNQKTPGQCERLRRMRFRSRKQVKNLLQIFRAAIDRDPHAVDVYFEWPTGTSAGWRLPEIQEFEKWFFEARQTFTLL